MTASRFSIEQLMEGLQVGHSVAALTELGVMDQLTRPRDLVEVAGQLGLDATALGGIVDHLARATHLVRRTGRRFRTTRAWNQQATFLVQMYGLAFGKNVAQTALLLRNPHKAPGLVDRRYHAAALESGSRRTVGASVIPGLIRQLGIRRVLDLGCGPANLLIRAACADVEFRGWGVEASLAVIRSGRRRVREASVGRRVRLFHGDARKMSLLPRDVLAQVQAVVASQLVNEFFGDGTVAAVKWLTEVRSVFPGRVMIVADYYGRLGSRRSSIPMTLIHDHAQLLSGQGIPPPRLQDWSGIYQQAGARLVSVFEDVKTTRFIHILAL